METRRDSSDGGSVQRGRRKATEFHRSGATRCDSVLYCCDVLSWLFYSTRRSENKKQGSSARCQQNSEKHAHPVGHSLHLYVGLHAPGWLYVVGMPPRADEPLSTPRARATDLGRGPNLRMASGRAPCVPRSREHEERPAAGKEKNAKG